MPSENFVKLVADLPKLTPEQIENAVASLRGANVRPAPGQTFSMTVWVPKEFICEGDTPEESILRYIDSLEAQEAADEGSNR